MADEHMRGGMPMAGIARSQRSISPGVPGGSWYTWWRGDSLPTLPPVEGFAVERVDDAHTLATATRLSMDETLRRLDAGNRAYVARLHGGVAVHGWSATRTIEIGEINLCCALPSGQRYLWAFATEPAWRGRGLYPRLLQAILRAEMSDTERFWIGHEPGNTASARGIEKAGFHLTGELYIEPTGRMLLAPIGPLGRAQAGADVLGATLLA